jgi:hypothetical protein
MDSAARSLWVGVDSTPCIGSGCMDMWDSVDFDFVSSLTACFVVVCSTCAGDSEGAVTCGVCSPYTTSAICFLTSTTKSHRVLL